MKKLYTLFSLLSVGSLFAQAPTITMANMPTVGSAWNEITDSSLTSFPITVGSASAQAWNYSSAFGATYIVTNNIASPTGQQGASNYPSSTLAQLHPADSSNEFYFVNSSGLYLDGTYDYKVGGTGALDFSPNLQYIPTPITYNTSVPINNAAVHLAFSGTGYTVDYYIHYKTTFTIDAFGSLQTPGGTYPNTIRLKAFRQIWDTSYVTLAPNPPFINSTATDTTTTYMWLQNSGTSSSIVMTANFDKAGNITSASYLGAPVGIKEHNETSNISVFPNPTTGIVNIKLPIAEKANVSVFDYSGKKVLETNSNGTDVITLSIAELSSGFYFYAVSTPSYTKTGRLIKE